MPVPDEAIDACQRSHDAANENRSKSNAEQFDDHGCSALVCRHGIPLFAANIDTPGEQQKYAVALIEHLFNQIPPNSTVVVLYDVGCVMHRSLEIYPAMLRPDITRRLSFTTSAMHAYAHQWSCQLVYNPRLQVGLGLTDGEAVERLWSQSRRIIGITRTSGRTRRLWLLDRLFSSIGASHREDLGDWISRRTAFAKKEYKQSRDAIRLGGISIEELSVEWAAQRKAQLSSKAHTPLRLKQELDTILHLQSEVETVAASVKAAQAALSSSATTQPALTILPELVATSDKLRSQADAIYNTLSVSDRYPELQHCSFDFVRTLLVLHDLKIHIRKRAVGSFFEWDRLDQAVGGRNQALGTKKHQRTRQAITKRKPALFKAITKFNSLCESLRELYDPSWRVPLPEPLPTQLSVLRDAQSLLEDVWISPSETSVPRWLENLGVRNGIRAMHKFNRCQEEQQRILWEVDNMSSWIKAESRGVEMALNDPKNEPLTLRLQLYQQTVRRLTDRWSNALSVPSASRTSSDRPLLYAPQTQLNTTITIVAIEAQILEDEEQAPGHEEPALEVEEVILSDILDEELGLSSGSLADEYPDRESGAASTPLSSHEALPDVGNDLFGKTEIVWSRPDNLLIDGNALASVESTLGTPTPVASSALSRSVNGFVIDHEAIQLLAQPTAWLDDVCINGCARMIQSLYSDPSLPSYYAAASRTALFSTHDLVRLRGNASDEVLWKHVAPLNYWDKTVWVFPIHRPSPESHWVLCVAYPYQQRIHMMDSFAAKTSWCRDIEVKAVQKNSYDCGLWVLAGITAVLKGRHLTGLRDEHICGFRRTLYELVLRQPPHVRQNKNLTKPKHTTPPQTPRRK
ncbi:hypothetical protein ONZ45_g15793 [Pleurotus djamor]|nr:hypothetical protein ONZ45_g15793 [Pleurotus djamor]